MQSLENHNKSFTLVDVTLLGGSHDQDTGDYTFRVLTLSRYTF